MTDDNLCMIPGPVEVSPAVTHATDGPPPSHLAEAFVETFGTALEMMRRVWCASDRSQPFAVAGSGTLAMEMAVGNILAPGERALVVNTGYFSDRMATMIRRRGADVLEVAGTPGDVPATGEIERVLDEEQIDALFATHVDTSTGVRVDAESIANAADERGIVSVFDGVCATAGEAFQMEHWGADVYLTASQKAIGVAPGLCLMVASPRALRRREELSAPPPLNVDWHEWRPIMESYERRNGSYFSTPATTLIRGLEASLTEILNFAFANTTGIAARVAAHERAAEAMRAGWEALGLELFPERTELAANTMSALDLPEGVDASFPETVAAHGVTVAGGLYPGREESYFRVGHMGHVVTQPEALVRTVRAVGEALVDHGVDAPVEGAARAAAEVLDGTTAKPLGAE